MTDEQTADFFAAPAETEAPIILGAPPTEAPDFSAPPPPPPAEGGGGDPVDFAAAPPPSTDFPAPTTQTDEPYIGEVDATEGNAPIVLEPPAEGGDMMGFIVPPEETGGEPVEPAASGDDDDGIVVEEKEISPMTKWNEEWQVTLRERKDAENAQKGEVVEQARADLEKFQAERESRKEARMAKNRSDEQDKLEAIEADLENDNSWQRAVKLVELTADTAEEAADVGRMRDVMIHLKNENERAMALA